MDIKPVIINIDDRRLYAQTAFLVDWPDFLKEIQEVRHELKIDPKMQKNDYFKTASDDELSQLDQRTDVHKVAAQIRQKYKYPPYFDDIVVQAILFNKVSTNQQIRVVTHLAKQITTSKSKPDLSENHFEMTIHITPLSTKEEVIEAFEESKKLRGEYEKSHPLAKILDKVALNNIVRDRNWHWDKLSGLKYSQIHEKWNKDPKNHFKEYCPEAMSRKKRCEHCYIDDENDIVQAVSRYRKSLSTHLFR